MSSRRLRVLALVLAGVTAAGALTGCSTAPPNNAADGVVRIVASTNVYGDIAQTIGGPGVEVTSVIEDGSQDPHDFQANGRVQLALSRADIVIANGGGYDDFMATMLAASGNEATMVNAVDGSTQDADPEHFNEHVWFDYDAMIELAEAIAAALAAAEPEMQLVFARNAEALTADLQRLGKSADRAAQTVGGTTTIVTEPVPLLLLDRMRIANLTPDGVAAAIEQGTDIPPLLLKDVVELIGDGDVDLVVFNPQTAGPQTDAVLAAAAKRGVPVVAVPETMPATDHYVSWQTEVQSQIIGALAS